MSRSKPLGEPHDWVTRAADDAIRHHEKTGADGPVTCSSGISPSGPVHLGNLREFLMPHFVADELRRRGVPVRHLHVWDDYDRFRKVPAGVDPAYAEHIGRPLVDVPDPWGCHDSWSTHFKEPVLETFAALGAEVEDHLPGRALPDAASTATRCCARSATAHEIDAVLAKHRTRKVEPDDPADETDDHAAQEAEAMADSVANDDQDEPTRPACGYFPFKPYCRDCGRDTTTVTAYDDETTDLAYVCSVCDYHGTTNLATQDEGKLVWKADWPMRWAFEHVDFEPAGMDHATPGSSFTVGHELVETVWDYPRPAWFGYGFVGFAGVQKMSSSAGGAPTAEDALRVLEPGILRWLYVRRQPKQTFDIDFGPEVVRLYDEWDALARKAADPEKRDVQVLAYERASSTATAGPLPTPRGRRPVPDAGVGRRRDRRLGRADQPHRSARWATPTTRSTSSSRGCRGRWPGPRSSCRPPTAPRCARSPTRRRSRRCRARSASGCRCSSTGLQGDLELDAVTVARVRRTEAGARDGPRREADRRGEGRPEGVLPAALPPARRRRARPAPADADRGPGRRPGAAAARRLAAASGVRGRGAGVAQERPSSAATRRPRRSRGRRARAWPGSAGSRGWARAPTAPGRGPSSRCGGAGRGCGGSRPGRRRRPSRRRRPASRAWSARAAQAAGEAG